MKYWTMRNGEEILIKDMTTTHLDNTIKLLERTFDEDDGIEYSGCMGFDDWNFDCDVSYYEKPEDMFPVLKDLRREYKKRIKENKLCQE